VRSLVISLISIGILVTSWIVFVNYADKNIHELMNMIDDDILISANAGDWDKASDDFKNLSDKWHKQKKIYSLFIDTKAINDTDFSIARAKKYIGTKNLSLSAGELNCIKEQLGFLHLNEILSIENII